MVTIYKLLEVREDASKEEIEKSYQKLILEYQINPSLTEEENHENEMILSKLKMAYEILMNDQKRKKYDNDLAKKRAEKLIENVVVGLKEDRHIPIQEEDNFNEQDMINKEPKEEAILTEKEKIETRKAAQREFNQNLKKAIQIEEEYNQAYNKAYNDYLKKISRSQGASILGIIKNTIITLLVIIIVCFIAWNIPPIKNILSNIYEDNFIIKSLVDIFIMLLKSITSIFK